MAVIVICIDGPVGAGKSLTIKTVSEKLRTEANIRVHNAFKPLHLWHDWHGLIQDAIVNGKNAFLFEVVELGTILDGANVDDNTVDVIFIERSKDVVIEVICDVQRQL